MANLKEVKNRINSVVSTQQITKAMKMVAAAKLKRAQDRITMMRPYSQHLSAILQNVSENNDGDMDNPYAEQRPVGKLLIVLVTSDKGLCGAFNSFVVRKAKSLMEGQYLELAKSGNIDFLPIGKKGMEYVRRNKLPYNATYVDLFNSLNFADVSEAANYVMKEFTKGTYDKVEILYNEFINAATQVVNNEQFLPIEKKEEEGSTAKSSGNDYIYEPSKDYIQDELIPTSLKTQFFKALLDSNASEQGARMTAMDKATENAGDLLKELRLKYNRTRQAAITTEILEITAGAEALAAQ
ncbi:ATP synthase F1 subunit gamma [Marivirga sp. S37H4]|uniref:ATP synthase gamma chain n=1 Tax=Marivirga aurantiaca TaxID=2802615 RepID=A0A934WZM7_9BACT|nr:ATP synthase F1 subunit gamma [Marivirga aurantiaca]MBK6265836.1 ATP synthase F1 subunit gamma [Marivirga aurantiaca]